MTDEVKDIGLIMTNIDDQDKYWMEKAIQLALEAEAQGEVPVGAVMVYQEALLSVGYNQPIQQADPSAHAEIIALRAAGIAQQNYRLPETTLYVTLEPCPMCTGAMLHARIKRVVYAASDPKTGALGGCIHLLNMAKWNHMISVTKGVLAEESAELLKRFFKKRR
ncbi:MAG: tRNA adenosine(34) deaminase TadA [Pseudomonadota bacterium]|jgi:tRNA(adenine34) deaminase